MAMVLSYVALVATDDGNDGADNLDHFDDDGSVMIGVIVTVQ